MRLAYFDNLKLELDACTEVSDMATDQTKMEKTSNSELTKTQIGNEVSGFKYQFSRFYSVIHLILGVSLIAVEFYIMRESGQSSNIIGGIGGWAIISGIVGLLRSRWGVVVQLPILLASIFLFFVAVTGSLDATNFPSPAKLFLYIWPALEVLYVYCRHAVAKPKLKPKNPSVVSKSNSSEGAL